MSASHKEILKLAIPNIVSNISIPLLSTVDTILMGQLSALHLGAIGLGGMIFNFVYWNFGFLRMGTTGLTAQAIGSNNHLETSALLVRGIIIGLVAGLILIVIQIPLFSGALGLAPASQEVEGLANEYLKIRVFSAPAAIAIFEA